MSALEIDYHPKCVTTVFGTKQMPLIEIDEKKLISYAQGMVASNYAITGVQPKLSLWLEKSKKNTRFTIMDGKSNFIIKPQSETYINLPENEDVCMHVARELGIKTATHGLVRLPSGSLAYLTKRFEREGEKKMHCEDLCQLTETLTEHKYRGSYEKVGKTIAQYSTQSGLDVLRYFELIAYNFVIGNADMHLKNFSMLEKEDGSFSLSPAYDLVSTILVIKNENEQTSLTLNGRKNRITKRDFDTFGIRLGLNEKQLQHWYQSLLKKLKPALWWVNNSFLPKEQKDLLVTVVSNRINLFNA